MPCKAALGPYHYAKCLPRSLSEPLEQLEEKSAFWGLPPWTQQLQAAPLLPKHPQEQGPALFHQYCSPYPGWKQNTGA